MEVLSSRILLRPADLGRSRHFYRDVLGLAVYREFGPALNPAVVFFLGQGLLEMWIEDPDGVPIVLVEVPVGHPLRRDQR
ncbi:MAG TPA: hypothetical protein VF838_04175 [Trebonia sp.]